MAAPSGSPVAMVCRVPSSRSTATNALAPASTTYNWRPSTRMPCGRPNSAATVCTPDPVSLTTRPAPASDDQPAAVGRGHHANRVIQTRGDHLDVPVPDRQHPSRPEFGDRDGVVAGDRHAVQLIESVCQHLAFATGRSVPRHLTARGGHDEFAGS